ncbi:matrixin family metalloprotease [Terrarubrum flagellatum]|uniref:matrixin family metalloprotease n=1 Tax=Terrirubrum flagellatum TaxID=2895980 RepID=UPI003144F8EF
MAVVFLDPEPSTGDGFDVAAQYQMVPSGGHRRMGLWVQADETEDVIIYPADPNKIGLWGLYTIDGRPAVTRGAGYQVARNSAIRFFMRGRDPGPTALIVETVSGKPRSFLLVSVKTQRALTYQLYVLSDAVRKPNIVESGGEMKTIMADVARLFIEQANVKLTQVGDIANAAALLDLNARDPLKRRIFLDDPTIFSAIASAALAAPHAIADLYIFRTWDIVIESKPDLVGLATGNCCFVENFPPGNRATSLYAHEIGHNLGLFHDNDAQHIMFPNIGGLSFSMHDIETMNFGYPIGAI